MIDLPGVGENLMDHQGTAVFLVPRDELSSPDARVCQLGRAYSSSLGTAEDDMWLSMWSPWDLTDFPDMQSALGVRSTSALVVGVHDPLSRGTVRLRTTDPGVRPQVDFRMLTDPGDLPRLVEGLQLVMSLAGHRAFSRVVRRHRVAGTIERGRPRTPSRATSSRRSAGGTTLPAPAAWAPTPTMGPWSTVVSRFTAWTRSMWSTRP